MIVPVYFAHAEFRRCLASLLRHTDLARHRVIVVLDGPGPGRGARAPSSARRRPSPSSSSRTRGAAASWCSVNRGMAASDRDVILLNSDTEVTAGWVEKLQAAADSDAAVATVTPSRTTRRSSRCRARSRRTRCPSGLDVDSFGRVVESVLARAPTRGCPPAVGVCMLIRAGRAPRDRARSTRSASASGTGRRTTSACARPRAGFVHVLDDATFVYHAGQRSFGASRPALARAAMRSLTEAHPEYLPRIAAFMKADPLREVAPAGGGRAAAAAHGRGRRRARGGSCTSCTAGRPGTARAPRPTRAGSPCGRRRAATSPSTRASPTRSASAARRPSSSTTARACASSSTTSPSGTRCRATPSATRGSRRTSRASWTSEAPELVHVHHLAGPRRGPRGGPARAPHPVRLPAAGLVVALRAHEPARRGAARLPRPRAGALRALPAADRHRAGRRCGRTSCTAAARRSCAAALARRRRGRDGLGGDPPLVPRARLARARTRGRVIPYGVEPTRPRPRAPPAARPLRFAIDRLGHAAQGRARRAWRRSAAVAPERGDARRLGRRPSAARLRARAAGGGVARRALPRHASRRARARTCSRRWTS